MGLVYFVKHFFKRFSFGSLVHVHVSRQLFDLRFVKERHVAVEDLVRFAVVVEFGAVEFDQKSCQIVVRQRFALVQLNQVLVIGTKTEDMNDPWS